MVGIVSSISVAVGLALLLLLAYGAIQSHREHESRATGVFVLLAIIVPLPYLLVGLLEFDNSAVLATALLVFSAAAALILVVPIRPKSTREEDTPTTRIDERDIMFSRALLEIGTERFERYYRENPDKREPDDRFRAEPGLLKKGSRNYSPYTFSAADASFTTVKQLQYLVDGRVAPEPVISEPREMTEFIKRRG